MAFSLTIQKYVDDQYLSSEEVSNLPSRARENLDNEVIYRLITTNKITFKQALGLTLREHSYLKTEVISGLLTNEKLSFEQAREISNRLITPQNISLPKENPYYNSKKKYSYAIRIEFFISCFNEYLIRCREQSISDDEMRPFLFYKDSPGLTYMERNTLGSKKIYELIDQNLLTLDDAIYLDINEYEALTSEGVQQLIAAQKLTVEQTRNLKLDGVRIIKKEAIRELIYKDILTVEEACSLKDEEVENLTSYSIIYLLINKKITLKQARNLSPEERDRFNGCIRFYVNFDLLTFSEVLELSINEYKNLTSRNIFKLIQIGKIGIDLARNFSSIEREKIDKFYDFTLNSMILRVELLTIEQITALKTTHFTKMYNAFLNADNLINKFLSHLCIPNIVVEETLSYFTTLAGSPSTLGINLLTTFINEIEFQGDIEVIESSIKENVSRRVFDKTASLFKDINDPQFIKFMDIAVKVSLEALTSIMPEYITKLKDTKSTFWQQERDEEQVSSVKKDQLKTLTEQLWGVESDLGKIVDEIKLPNFIVEEAVSYLQLQSKVATVPEFESFKATIHNIEYNRSVKAIWEFIKENVANRMREEASSFYETCSDFNSFLETEASSSLNLSLNKKFQKLKNLQSEHITLVDQHRPPMALSHKNPIEDSDLRLLNIFLDFRKHSISTGRKARFCLFKSKIKAHTTLEEIVSNVVSSIENKSKSRSRNVFITLGWLDASFRPTDREPRIRELFNLERAKQHSQLNY